MPLIDPTVKLSVTVPSSLSAELEEALSEGEAQNRSQAVSQALRVWLDGIREKRLRAAVSRLTDDDALDADYTALRTQK
jgi:Arc/MetJ-type ribon-helix-helix transcriptional regulator